MGLLRKKKDILEGKASTFIGRQWESTFISRQWKKMRKKKSKEDVLVDLSKKCLGHSKLLGAHAKTCQAPGEQLELAKKKLTEAKKDLKKANKKQKKGTDAKKKAKKTCWWTYRRSAWAIQSS